MADRIVTAEKGDRTPNWDKWRLMPNPTVWECVALSLNIDPDKVHKEWLEINLVIRESQKFNDRIDVALANAGDTGALRPTRYTRDSKCWAVSFREFAAWVHRIGWDAPPELLAIGDQRSQNVNWNHWGALDLWPLDAACKLISGYNPNEPTRPGDIENSDIEWVNLYHLAVSAINAGNLSDVNGEVIPAKFIAWAQGRGRDVPHDAPLKLLAMAGEHVPAEGRPQAGAAGPKWPWGSHETERLRHLAAAADRFWKNYDPSDPTTGPTNQEVIDWLVEQGVTSRTAESIASILRADGLPTGPRK